MSEQDDGMMTSSSMNKMLNMNNVFAEDLDEDTIVTEAKTLKVGDFVSFRTHSNIGEQLHKRGHNVQIFSLILIELKGKNLLIKI